MPAPLRTPAQDDAAPRFVGGQELRIGGLGGPPDAAPEVDLPGHVQRHEEDVQRQVVRDGGELPSARGAALVAPLGDGRPRGHQDAARLLDTGHRGLEVVVVAERGGDRSCRTGSSKMSHQGRSASDWAGPSHRPGTRPASWWPGAGSWGPRRMPAAATAPPGRLGAIVFAWRESALSTHSGGLVPVGASTARQPRRG